MLHSFASKLTHPVFKVVSQVIEETNQPAFIIGGFVRDLILGIPSKDIDIVTVGDGTHFAKRVAEILRVKQIAIYKNYGTAHFKYKDIDVEFVGARRESYQSESRNPSTQRGTLRDDQLRRDFTVNALALSLDKNSFGELIDPFNGMNAIEKGIIQTPTNPEITFSDDPLRMLRAIRFATRLNFSIDISCLEAMKANHERIKIVSKERIAEELNKMILTETPSRAFKLLKSTGILQHIFPELLQLSGIETIQGKSHKDNFIHTLEVLDNLSVHSESLWLRWGALLHDIAKPATKRFDPQIGWTFHGHEEIGARMVPRIFKAMKLPLDNKMKYVQKLVRLHLRPIALVKGSVTDSAIRRLLNEAGDDIDDLMLLCNADITSKNEFKVKKYRENFQLVSNKLKVVEEKDNIRNFQPPVTGEIIMKTFNIGPCAEIGLIKSYIKEAILEGEIDNNYADAVKLMLKLGSEHGLKVHDLPSISN
jgi:poly(A) polymerase